jgi:hypothetical protein
VAAGPCVPSDDVPRGQRPGSEGGEEPLDLRDGQRDQPGLGRGQLIRRNRGGAVALGALTGGADLPAPLALRQPLDRFLAGQFRPAGQHDHEVRRDPQHVGLAAGLEELAQLGAGAVDLVPAGEIEAQPVGVRGSEDVDGQLPLGAERQVRRQPGDQRLDRVLDVLGRD